MLQLKDNYKLNDFEKEFIKIGNKIYSWQLNGINRDFVDRKKFKLSADLLADRLIKLAIKKFFYKDQILSEENKLNKIKKNFWLIDPIDGTRSFYNNFKGFVSQAVYVSKGNPIYAIVYAPALKKIWTANLGSGAFLNGRIIKKKNKKSTIKFIDNYPEPRGIAKLIAKKIPNAKYIESGSIGLKACLVADGTATLFVKDIDYKDWDIIPALLINLEVGKIVCDFDGKIIKINKNLRKRKGLVVCESQLVPKILRIVNEAKKKK
jgi:fructose-1,6-bisphosphatase/inositol monophosphatase family enzyme